MFSHTLHKFYVITSRFDWFPGLSFVTGRPDYFGFGFMTFKWNHWLIYTETLFFCSAPTHEREVQQNDARRERNFRIRRHLSVDDTEQTSLSTEASQVTCVIIFYNKILGFDWFCAHLFVA